MLAATPAHAATAKACPTKGTATATCLITWTGDAFSPATTTVREGVSVQWINNGNKLNGPVTISKVSGPVPFTQFDLARGDTKTVGFPTTGKAVVKGDDRLGPTANGTINVVAAPTPAPGPTHTTSTSPKPSNTTKPKPTPTPTTAPPVVTNPPPLGIGTIVPTPVTPGLLPNPLVAGPDVNLTPTPDANVEASAPHALSQSVPARKYGLPGALAAVILTGVVVGVVRLARVEFGNGNGHHPPDD